MKKKKLIIELQKLEEENNILRTQNEKLAVMINKFTPSKEDEYLEMYEINISTAPIFIGQGLAQPRDWGKILLVAKPYKAELIDAYQQTDGEYCTAIKFRKE